jgi:uncharacterized membrane protein YfcA
MESLAGIVAAFVGVFLVSAAPSDLQPLAIVVLVVVYFLGFVVRGYIRAGRPRNRSSR